jgi:hypothetical protein
MGGRLRLLARRLGWILAALSLCACQLSPPGPAPDGGSSPTGAGTGSTPTTGGRSIGGTTSGRSTGATTQSNSSGGASTGGSSASGGNVLQTVGLSGVIAGGSDHTCALVSGGVPKSASSAPSSERQPMRTSFAA